MIIRLWSMLKFIKDCLELFLLFYYLDVGVCHLLGAEASKGGSRCLGVGLEERR